MASAKEDDIHKLMQAVFEQGRIAPTPIDTPDGGKLIVYPAGYQVRDIGPVEEPLPRIDQNVALHDLDSFIAYVNRFKHADRGPTAAHEGGPEIFGEPGFVSGTAARIVAKLDYHTPASPAYLKHTASYHPRYSEQWQRWHNVCKEAIGQAELAEFIEEASRDFLEPSAAQLMDIVRYFKASKAVQYDSAVYTNDGSIKINYSEEVMQQNRMKGASPDIMLPEKFKIQIPVYFRDASYAMNVFIRFNVHGGKVFFKLKLDRPDIIEDDAFEHLIEKVKTETEIVPFLGRV
jgi:uncharacterized protein YfdQ (DUF2303 family)